MDSNFSLNTAAIAALESGDPQQIYNLSMLQRPNCSPWLVVAQHVSKSAENKWAFLLPSLLHGLLRPGPSLPNAPVVQNNLNFSPDAAEVAARLAAVLDKAGCEYALGGAIALGFWSQPRGTLDVDVTLFISPEQPTACVRLLQSIGCTLQSDHTLQSIAEHGFCQVEFQGRRLDVFLPTTFFYEQARARRQTVLLTGQKIQIWDAETLCVFKMMFFRRKDVADIEQLLRVQKNLDRNWVLQQLTAIYGVNDPRIVQWQELVAEQA